MQARTYYNYGVIQISPRKWAVIQTSDGLKNGCSSTWSFKSYHTTEFQATMECIRHLQEQRSWNKE